MIRESIGALSPVFRIQERVCRRAGVGRFRATSTFLGIIATGVVNPQIANHIDTLAFIFLLVSSSAGEQAVELSKRLKWLPGRAAWFAPISCSRDSRKRLYILNHTYQNNLIDLSVHIASTS
jgi:hypothetical protein